MPSGQEHSQSTPTDRGPCGLHRDDTTLAELLAVARDILNDATGDLYWPSKRIWPIRSDNYRRLAAIIERVDTPEGTT